MGGQNKKNLQENKRKENENESYELNDILSNLTSTFTNSNGIIGNGFKELIDMINNNNKICSNTNDMCEIIMEKIVTMERKISNMEQMLKVKNEDAKDTKKDEDTYKILENITETCWTVKDKVDKNHELLLENNKKKKKEK